MTYLSSPPTLSLSGPASCSCSGSLGCGPVRKLAGLGRGTEQLYKGHSGLCKNGEVTCPQELGLIKKTTVTMVLTLESTEGLKGTHEPSES